MRLTAWTGLLLAVVALSACNGSKPTSTGTTLQRDEASHTVRIGYANEAPYAYLDSATGRVTGEAPEIARVVLAKMGIDHVQPVLTEFGSLIPGLKAGRFDIIAAGMYILPQRCKQVRFSNPTYSIGEAFAVRAGNPDKLHSYADLAADPHATLGVVAGTVEREYARATGIPNDRVVVFPNAPSALAGVQAGRVNAYGGTSLTVRDLVAKAGDAVEVAQPFSDPVIKGKRVRGYGAFAFRKQDADFVAAFNRQLAGFIGSPAHAALVRPFGFTHDELPGKATAAQLCKG